ncbi:MAG: hypothetical protein QW324_05105 [Thermofilaceae archaeon]
MNDEVDMVPEKAWWRRTAPISMLPREIEYWFQEVRRRFGIDVANMVLSAYRRWGPAVAQNLARRILSFESADELFSFLVSKIDLLDERSREVLAALIHQYKYVARMEKLQRIARVHERTCPGVTDAAIRLYHALAVRGIFHSEECIVSYALLTLNCSAVAPPNCADVFEKLSQLAPQSKREAP